MREFRTDVIHLPLRGRLVVLDAARATPVSRPRRAYGRTLLLVNLIGWLALAVYLGS